MKLDQTHFSITDLLVKMYENSSDIIFFFDKDGSLIHLNEAAKQIIDPDALQEMLYGKKDSICLVCRGYTNEEELITCNSCYFHHSMGERDKSIQDFHSFQVYLKTRGAGILPYTASFQLIDPVNDVHALMLRQLSKQMETQNKLLKNATIKNAIKAQEDERKRISRELHDGVAQEVLSSLVDIQVVKYLKTEEEVEERLRRVEGSLAQLLEDIGNLAVELRPSALDDLGVEAAFRSHFSWIEKNYGLAIYYQNELDGKRFNNEIETVLYRIGQEAILNVLKYAEVDEIYVRLYEDAGQITLKVIDHGNGFSPEQYDAQGTGLGLWGMRERAELVNGNLVIQSEPNKGTEVKLEIPILGGKRT